MPRPALGLAIFLSSISLAGCGGSEFEATGNALAGQDGGAGGPSASGGVPSPVGGSTGAGGQATGGSGTASGGAVGGGSGGETASGGSSGSSGGAGATDGGTVTASGGAGAGGAGAGGAPTVIDAGQGCSDPPTWYPDTDQDGYGRSTGSVRWCTPPSGGNWVARGGDCNDDEEAVNPGQDEYFAEPYATGAGGLSFDYNCSGTEESSPESVVLPTCSALNLLLSCRGSGFAPTERAEPGSNAYCGSTNFQVCAWTGLVCKAQTDSDPASGAFLCR